MKDISCDLDHWKHIADVMAEKHPDTQFKVVQGMHGDYMVCSVIVKTGCETVYMTEVAV